MTPEKTREQALSLLTGKIRARLFVPVFAAMLLLLISVTGLLPVLSGYTLDFLFMLRGSEIPNRDIVIVGIDEDSLETLGTWPFPRKLHAQLLSRLSRAKGIGFDILFREPSNQDDILSRAFALSPPVVLGVGHDFQGRLNFPSSTLQHYTATGLIETNLDSRGLLRSINAGSFRDTTQPPPLAEVLAGLSPGAPLNIPNDSVLINFYGPEGTFLYLSYADVLAGKYADDFFSNRFVLIGVAALGLGDVHATPFSRSYPMPGVEVQATILSNLLNNDLLIRISWFPWLCTGLIILVNLFVWPLYNEQINIAVNLLFLVGILLFSAVFFHKAVFLDPALPVLYLTASYLLYLVVERIRTANAIYREMSRIDSRIQEQMQSLYANIPPRFFQYSRPASRKGSQLELVHLRAGLKTLSLQYHFLEKLLREDLPPLILWDVESEQVVLTNTMFRKLWRDIVPDSRELPALGTFNTLIQEQNIEKKPVPSEDEFMQQSKAREGVIDICLQGNGRKRYFRLQFHRVVAEDADFQGILTILTDITEIKELELLKDEILSVVSHELKLPLTVMLGYGEMLSLRLQGKDKEQIEKILAQTVRMKNLIEHFLDIARLEHGHQELHMLPFDPLHLVREAEQAVAAVAEKKDITLIRDVPNKVTPLVGDFSMLSQAGINLLENAVKFSPRQTSIIIRVQEESRDIIFCVVDQGPGIAEDMREDIFEKFNRGKNSPKQEGFGLGLAFVREVIRKHGGRLYLDTNVKQGAAFCFTLPKYTDSDASPSPSSDKGSEQQS